MAHLNFHSPDYSPQVTGNTDSDYSASTSASQHRPLYSVAPDDSSIAQHNTSVLSSENTNVTSDHKPALPPKPIQGPPTYREPPTPPVHDEVVHPDICINSANPSHHRINDNGQYSHLPNSNERPDRLASRTHAWVQEHKSSGKLVGEKLSSLQRKLRSFLSQSSTKESTELEKPSTSIEEKPRVEAGGDNWNFHPSLESTRRPRTFAASGYSMNPSTSEQQLNYISPSSFGGNSVALPISQPTNHGHHYKTYQTERHPFAAPNLSEHEDSTDPDQMRDTCNKFFAREQRISWTNYLNPRNSYSNNIKSTYDYDKLVPKEVIGRPSQEKKPEVSANCEAICGSITPFPSFAKALEISPKPTEQSSRTADGSYYAKRIQNSAEDQPPPNPPARPPNEATLPNEENETSTEPLPASTPDCGDVIDMYKSSSESGRGTMHSSMHGSKSVVSPHSSGVSAASNLDTSIDSDHSTNGAIWGQQNRSCQDKRYPDEFQVNKVRHIYETPNASGSCRQTTDKELDDGTSESLSVTPPLPPLSPAPSPGSAENSPKLSSRAKYKLSLSASALNSYGKSNDHQQKCEMVPSKTTSGKKSGVRRTTSINQTTCRHRSGKSSQYTKALASSGHRLGIAHSNCASRKCNSSPPSRHHSRSQLAFPCYLDNADAELTSTTTGLDMESLLDDDDYSSDLSATASTMEPNEVNMIRKQLEGLETMYSEILRLLGVKNSSKAASAFASSLDVSRHSRRKLNGSLSSLTARSSVSRSNHSFVDKRGFSEKRRTKECRTSSASKRLQRLESHVVTLARSVAHLSSEMRTQHILVQELENMRQDVTWVQERLRLMQLAQGCHPNNGAAKGNQLTMHRDWDNFHKEVLELLNPSRAKKLTKFFGDEPPLIRQFLKRLGYEKYATNFENEKIGIKELPYLTEERLQKMGVPMGPRIRILQEAQSSCPQNQYKVYIV